MKEERKNIGTSETAKAKECDRFLSQHDLTLLRGHVIHQVLQGPIRIALVCSRASANQPNIKGILSVNTNIFLHINSSFGLISCSIQNVSTTVNFQIHNRKVKVTH